MDVPAGAHGPDLTALVRRAQTVIIPVLPSPTDIRAAAHFIHEALLVGKIVRNETRLAVVANRVRENTSVQNTMESVLNRMSISYSTLNTQIYHNLERFLSRLRIPFIATLRESQNYLVADARGLGIFDLNRSQVTRDTEQWEPLLKWLESKRSIPEPVT
jgi:chromosome partitioning protein